MIYDLQNCVLGSSQSQAARVYSQTKNSIILNTTPT